MDDDWTIFPVRYPAYKVCEGLIVYKMEFSEVLLLRGVVFNICKRTEY